MTVRRRTGYRYGQIGSAALVSLAHGTNDAQKTMGIIALALISTGHIDPNHFYVPFWVKLVCALAISLGTVTGGWRIINTMGNRITSIESPQGFAAEAASGSVILASSYYGYPLSTTQVVSGGVTGAGLGKKQPVHWNVFGQMVSAWILTIPAAGIVAAGAWEIADIFGDNSDVGCIVIVALTIVIAAAPVDHQPTHRGHRQGPRPHQRHPRGRGRRGLRAHCRRARRRLKETDMLIFGDPIIDWTAIWKIVARRPDRRMRRRRRLRIPAARRQIRRPG